MARARSSRRLTTTACPSTASWPPAVCPRRTRMLMQIYADVTGREFRIVRSSQGPALGSAMHGAVAAGGMPAATPTSSPPPKDGRPKDEVYTPIPENVAIYDQLYAEYKTSTTTSAAGKTM